MRRVTAHVPGTGGVFKESAEDFLVEEMPLYLPCGEGEHLYLLVEKRGITTLEAIRRIGRALQLPEREIGYAGMKDARGVTRQYLSLPARSAQGIGELDIPAVRILSAQRHRNKLKLGHLRGNRFSVVIRDTVAGAAAAASAVLEELGRRGMPNFFGSQRYGSLGNSHLIGLALLQGEHRLAVERLFGDPADVRDAGWREAVEAARCGDYSRALQHFPPHCRTEREVARRLAADPEGFQRAFGAVDQRLRRLYVNAAQSFLFDRVLEERIGNYDTLLPGDVAWKHDNGACFLVEDPAAEAPRAERLEISPTGPLFGQKMKQPEGEAAELEERVLRLQNLLPGGFASLPPSLRPDGERRPLRVPVRDASVRENAGALTLDFALPRGSYATSLLAEVMK